MSETTMFRPPINRAMRTLDRAFFRRTFPISAARVTNNNDISMVRKALEKSQDILVQPRYQAVWSDPAEPGKRIVLLKPEIKHNGRQKALAPRRAALVFDADGGRQTLRLGARR